MRQHRAASGTVVIMDPWTGEVLAMANEPTFNPNKFGKAKPAELRNRAIQDIYEPGSTFKIVTASAALEERVIRPSDYVDVSQGYIRIGSRQIDDVHRYKALSFTDVIVKSSNVGAIKVGLKLGADRLNRYVRRFGFGRTLSPDLKGEERGIVWSQLNDSALASVSMGYQIGVTPLQMAAAVSSVANGGQLIEPRLVHAIQGPSGRVTVAPKTIRRTINDETAAALTAMMEEVVERGTAQSAKVDGFTIAGKTGTAAKLVNGVYSKSDYMSSFVGFLPSRKPVATIIVVIDSPRGAYYGGVVAAPIFKRIAQATLRHFGVPPTINPPPAVMVKRESDANGQVPVSGPAVSPLVVPASIPPDCLPDVRGLGAREAIATLVRLGVKTRLKGTGMVLEQRPEPGTPLGDIEQAELRLGRLPRPQNAAPFVPAVGVTGARP
jgi:cell division protein FtsI/penicillin-binding protein 2